MRTEVNERQGNEVGSGVGGPDTNGQVENGDSVTLC